MAKDDTRKWFMIGAIVGTSQSILLWLIGLVEPIKNLLSPYVTGVDTTLANYVANLLEGIITFPPILISAIGGGLLFLLGKWIYDQKWSWNKLPFELPLLPLGAKQERLVMILVYASIGMILITSGLQGIQWIPSIITILINSYVISWFILGILDKRLGFIDV